MTQVVSPREGYRLWAESFDVSGSPIVALESRHLEPVLTDVAGKQLIDVGCGTGRWLRWAIERGARIVGADLSAEMLRAAARKPGIAGRLIQADSRRLPFPDASADIVLCTLVMGHTQAPAETMAELARLAKPRGRVIVTDFHPEAIRVGWKRTFRRGSDTFEIRSDAYSVAQLSNEGLVMEDLRDLHFGEPERSLFEATVKGPAFEEACAVPAILMACYRRIP